MNIVQEILATAPKPEREFETRIYDASGRLVALLPMERSSESFYVSEIYAGPNVVVSVLIFRDGAPWRVVAQGMPIGAGFNLNATIERPDDP